MDALLDQVLALALEGLGDGLEPMLPFALVVSGDAQEMLHVVTASSDRAHVLGRRLVRERAATADRYALAFDAVLNDGGRRDDAVFVELGARDAARLVAARYAPQPGGRARWVGEPVELGERRSALVRGEPRALDWGAITPDLVVERDGFTVHIVAHALDTDADVDRTVRFLRARLAHHARHLPPHLRQGVHVDDRGQDVTAATRARLRDALADLALFVRFTTEDPPR